MEIVVPDDFRYLFVQSAERPIVKVPDPVLRKKAIAVAKFSKKHQLLIDQMLRAMRQANGIGLAAPQLGVLQRVIVIANSEGRSLGLVNPVITAREGEQIGEEGCLSIPGLYGNVVRSEYVLVEALDRRGREITVELEGMDARVLQHEVDHLEGVLFTDKVDPSTLHWRNPEIIEEL